WFDPRYVIPIAGMMVGNAMTGVTLGIQSLLDNMSNNRDKVEAALMLGATPKQAVKRYVDRAFDSAVLPTINNMVGMGIVFLPGMMTGQILAGLSPVTAIQYQLAIMLGILGGVAMSVILFTQLAYKTFFTEDAQLRPRLKEKKSI
ncbi:MAG TPA: ABC transporter permease, partial [Savagea sp.]